MASTTKRTGAEDSAGIKVADAYSEEKKKKIEAAPQKKSYATTKRAETDRNTGNEICWKAADANVEILEELSLRSFWDEAAIKLAALAEIKMATKNAAYAELKEATYSAIFENEKEKIREKILSASRKAENLANNAENSTADEI